MVWMIVGMSMLGLATSAIAATQGATNASKCAPPSEWGETKTFGEWRVARVCVAGTDMLNIAAAAQADRTRSLTLMCDADGPGGMITLQNFPLSGPVTLALKGAPAAAAMNLEASHMGVAPETVSLIEFDGSMEAKRLLTALVDGPGATFTLVVTSRGKPSLELAFSRDGLAAAVKPLRSKCGW